MKRIETRFEMLSMAERTGDPELDALINEFIKENPTIMYESWSGSEYDKQQPLDAMEYQPGIPGEEQNSVGMCGVAAEQFAKWLREHKINAVVGDEEWTYANIFNGMDPIQYEHDADIFGYADRTDPGNDWDTTHCVTIVEKDGHTYAIDWTASQYGYSEWPMVQRLDRIEDSQAFWQREWQ